MGSTSPYFAFPVTFLILVVPLQLFVAPNHIVNATDTVMKHVAVDGVDVLVVGLVRTERRLALSNRNYSASAVHARLPVAHLLLIVPDELLRTLNGIVDTSQTMVIDITEFWIGKITI